jgi:hypothetical protein
MDISSASSALDSNIDYGRGFDTLTEQSSDYCINYTDTGVGAGANGQQVLFSLTLLEHSSDLEKSLKVSAAASASWGVASVDAKTEFAESSKLELSHVYMLAATTVFNAPILVKNPTLKPDAADTLKLNPTRFRARCGDAFVSSVTTGGAYYGVLDIATSSKEDSQSIKASLSASYSTFKVAADFENSVKNIVKDKQVQVHSFQAGGAGVNADGCNTVDCMLDRATKLPEYVNGIDPQHPGNPVIVDIGTMSYSKLALPNDAQSPIDVSNQQEVEQEIATGKDLQRDLQASYSYAYAHQDEYLPFDTGTVATALNTISGNLNTLQSSSALCYRDYTKCAMPALNAVTAPMPQLKPGTPPKPNCANGAVTIPAYCSQDVCHPAQTTSCGNFACNSDGSDCLHSCVLDSECLGGSVCDSGRCIARCTGTFGSDSCNPTQSNKYCDGRVCRPQVPESGVCTSDAQCTTSYAGKAGWGCKPNSCRILGQSSGWTGTQTPPGTSICWGDRELQYCAATSM